jgi:hypothetical protein
MSRLSKHSTKKAVETRKYSETAVENFMGGTSYEMSPLQALKIVAASSIFGEPQYYRDGIDSKKTISNHMTYREYDIFSSMMEDKTSADEIFVSLVDTALDHDFKGTLDVALELRTEYFMRLNPSVIFIRASVHKNRAAFNEANPGYMKEIGKKIALRPDDLSNQFDYYVYMNGSKNGLSSVVKRTWAEKLEEYSRYQLNKYKGKKLIDLVRISHASNDNITELVKTGTLKVEENERTWESLRSEGKIWSEIISTIKIPHMALLRNLRGIFTEINDQAKAKEILDQLKSGVEKGMQFPFRYWSAYNAVKSASVNHQGMILDALDECMDIAVKNMPKLDGRVMSLCDNSGSARGTMNSEYGSVHVSTIANLSALITGMQSDEGHVGVFGDTLKTQPVSKRNGLLTQLKEVDGLGNTVGGGTENGIWMFWDNAIKNKEHWDTVFIYSDMQAGHGGLYGVNSREYADFIHPNGSRYIDVLALVRKYRETVNSKVNVFSVQVAGYNNQVIPENLYRGAILGGWTGKEPSYAKAIIDTWNQIESK